MVDREAIEAVINDYLTAYEAHDAQGCANVYSEDAIVLSPWGPPLFGPAAVAAAHEEWFREGERNKVMTIERLDLDNDTATCLVSYAADLPGDGDDPLRAFGASLNTLRRQAGGGWKIVSTSLNELEHKFKGSVP
jgi:uncharacterized protein (TIGR02246 family)